MPKAPEFRPTALTLRARMGILIVILTLLLGFGAFLMNGSQEGVSKASLDIRERVLPTVRIVDLAKSEIDLQLRELSGLALTQPKGGPGPQDQALVQLSPSTRALRALSQGPLPSEDLRAILKHWEQSATDYERQLSSAKGWSTVIESLKDVRRKTEVLRRALDRELSMQLLALAGSTREGFVLWIAVLAVTLAMAAVFILLVWRWMAPLEYMQRWLTSAHQNPQLRALSKVNTRGPFAPPAEVQSLAEALRVHVNAFRNQTLEMQKRTQVAQESERAADNLFLTLQILIRNNEELMKALIDKERLASMSEMAAQLAHEIRNPLNSMSLQLELLQEDLSGESRERLAKVLAEVDRLNALTESHLRTTRSRLQESNPFEEVGTPGRLHDLVLRSLEKIAPELAKRDIEWNYDPTHLQRGALAAVPENVLHAALLNLLKNAWEAPRAKDQQVKVHVKVENDSLEWRVRILDNGEGFPSAYLAKPFTPFHTHKSEGSGLGLSTAHAMLSAYGVKLEIAQHPHSEFRTELIMRGTLAETGRSQAAESNA